MKGEPRLDSQPSRGGPSSPLARGALSLVLLASALGFAWWYGKQYPVEHWLFWHYAAFWVACAAWSLACVSSGFRFFRRLVGTPLPFGETIVLSFATGVVLFYVAVNVLGALHGLHTAAFFLLPAAMIAVGAKPLWRYVRRYRRLLALRRSPEGRLSGFEIVAWAFGGLVLAMIYFKVLNPANAQFDAQWKHLALAEQYAHLGYMPRYPEGWTVATNPHLATELFTWGMLLPSDEAFDQVAMACHIEFTCFLWTLAMIPSAVRILVPGAKTRSTWMVRLLFPGVLLYDSSLAGGADHIAAMFALPIFILMMRSRRTLPAGRLALLGLMMAGAAMCKLTAAMLMVPGSAGVIAFLVAWRSLRDRKLIWRGPLAATAAALIATSPFWLRNALWYGDPLYPSLHASLTPHPWTPEAANIFEWGYKDFSWWRPERNWEGVKETFTALFNFSFVPNDYKRYHGQTPVFGSLFTILLLALPFFRRTKRIWLLVAMTHLAIFIWYWVHHQDRYLQVLVPWMATVTAAVLVHVWRAGLTARAAMLVLVGTQIVLGADVYFLQSHAMIKSPIKESNDLLSAGYEKKYEERFDVFSRWTQIRDALPEDAHVMLHDNHTHLGLRRRTTSDWGGWQYGISYARFESPAALWKRYRDYGVTHLVWQNRTAKGWDSIAGDLVFFDFAINYAQKPKRVGRHTVAELGPDAPPDEPYAKVAVFGCGKLKNKGPLSGLYELDMLMAPAFGPDKHEYPEPLEPMPQTDRKAFISQAQFVVLDLRCAEKMRSTVLSAGFVHAADRTRLNPRVKKKLALFVKRKPKKGRKRK